jgi:hypothetical protein
MAPGETIWNEPVWKGTASDFSEETETLRSPCFVATLHDEALHYARTLPVKGKAVRRVMELRPVRPLRLVLMDRTEHGQRLLADLGIAWTKPAGVSAALKAVGYDGLALDGGASGFHLVLNDGALVRLERTVPLEEPSPRPC